MTPSVPTETVPGGKSPVQEQTVMTSASNIANIVHNSMKNTKERDTLYVLRYKKGAASLSVNFLWTSDHKDAEKVAREYCVSFGLRFIWVENFCVDITQKPRGEDPTD